MECLLGPDAVIWRTLIWACKVHGDAKRAEDLMKQHLGTSDGSRKFK